MDKLPRWEMSNTGRGEMLTWHNGSRQELSIAWGLEPLKFLCLLAVLRITEYEDSERKAIAEFDGETFHPELPQSAKWSTLRSLEPDSFAQHLQTTVYPQLVQARAGSLLRILPRLLPANELDKEALRGVLTLLTRGPLATDDAFAPNGPVVQLQQRFQVFPGYSKYWRGVGEFTTPDKIADLMIDLVAPKAGEKIYNPCTGAGTLLVRTAERVILPALAQSSPALAETVRTSTFFGMEIQPNICLMALARLMLAGITRPRLELGDVLERPTPDTGRNGGFDVILCNPPIGSSATPEQSARFPIRSRSMETLVLQHVLAHLKPGGRAVVLMPEAFLYRPGAEEMLRKRILNEFRLVAVASVPEGAIHGLGELRTSLLVIHRRQPVKTVGFIQMKTTRDVLASYEQPNRKKELVDRLRTELEQEVSHEDAAGPPRQTDKGHSEPISLATQPLVSHEAVGTLADRRWELLPKSTGPDQLQVLLDAVQRTTQHAKIQTLQECCLVRTGMVYRRSDLWVKGAENPVAETDGVRLVRVRDISKQLPSPDHKLSVLPNMALLTKVGIDRTPKHCFLYEGDILLTVAGTIGKVAVVAASSPKMVAANGVVIIRATDPRFASYLPCLLTSEPYQRWLEERSVGGSINRLSKFCVDHLPVPVFTGGIPPDAIGHISVGQSLEGIIRLLEAKTGFSASVRFLLEDDLVRALTETKRDESTSKSARELLRDLVTRLEHIRHDGTVDEGIEPLFDWLAGFQDFAMRLLDIFALPLGPERFCSLQAWKLNFSSGRTDLGRAHDELAKRAQRASSDSAVIRKVVDRMAGLISALVDIWKADSGLHLAGVRLSASLSPAQTTIGIPTEISISVTNEGALPIRKLRFETSPYESMESWSLLPQRATHHWPVKILGKEIGKHRLSVRWTGRQMDEAEVTGEIELAFEVVSLRTAAAATGNLGENPYIYRRLPEGRHEGMFYGREAELRRIVDTLDRPSSTTILLVEGNRGIGKTWLLKQLIRRHLPEIWVPVFIDFQDFGGEDGPTARPGIPTRNIFIGMARELITAARTSLPQLEFPGVGVVPPVSDLAFQTWLDSETPKLISPEQSWTTFKTLFQGLRTALAPRRLLLVLEEFDRIQDGIDSKITSDQVPENFRSLFQHQGEVAGIFTGSRTIRRLRKDYWNMLFSLGEPVTLRGLQPEEARRLIEEPVSGRLVYAEEAIRSIIQLTACQPLLIQGICHRVFALCKQRKRASVTLELVQEVVSEKTADNEHFETLWDYIKSEHRRCLLFIIDEFEGKGVAVSFNMLRSVMEAKGLSCSRQELQADLKHLHESDILGLDRQDRQEFYRLEVPMFALWLRQNKDFDQSLAAAKDESL
ncbi:MAG: N-6 DNA methylase [Verrucomicrobia bacterium]|nr:N-6 DNA methylase [Verrucomicrobiota bacterium]